MSNFASDADIFKLLKVVETTDSMVTVQRPTLYGFKSMRMKTLIKSWGFKHAGPERHWHIPSDKFHDLCEQYT